MKTIGSDAIVILQGMADRAQQDSSLAVIASPAIEKRIVVIRERQVMLDEDLADLYGVETKRLVEQVKRNLERFPEASCSSSVRTRSRL
jgi:ORF6N domain